MKLSYKKIPEEFIEALPEGMHFLNKGGRDFLVVQKVLCPKGHDLMNDNVLIHGEPSIHIAIDTGHSKGLVYLDPFWGGHEKLFDFIPILSTETRVVEAKCPICGESMIVDRSCDQEGCNSQKSIVFALPGGKNKVYACAKVQCPGHSMEMAHIEDKVADQVSCINFFGGQEDDIFQWT